MNDREMCMIDLETLSTRPTAAVVSIGAVRFNTNSIISEFKVNIDAKSCKDHGLHISKDTIEWWSQQSKEARLLWQNDAIQLEDAFDQFIQWYGPKSIYTWGYGSAFDIAIMENALYTLNKPIPWKYWDVMCLRTISNMSGEKVNRKEGVHHDALVDARNQAHFLQRMIKGEPF